MQKILSLVFLTCVMPFFLIAQQNNSSEFMKGYIYSKLENRFCNTQIEFNIDNKDILIFHWPENLECEEIKTYLEDTCPEYNVQFKEPHLMGQTSFIDDNHEEACEDKTFGKSNFLPELNPFFPTMLAKPHILGYSVGYRSYDKVFKSSIPVSIGDQFSLYQFKINSNARLYVGIEACVWAIFKAKTKSLALINADYFVSIPITYISDKFSARLRLIHQSSHLGDEFLLETPNIRRYNPSMEVLDLSLAYEPLDNFVVFAGYARVLRCDEVFKVKPNSVYYGFNYFFDFAKIQTFHVQATPYIAAYIINNENNHWNFDRSIAIGYQWDKYYGRKLRLSLEAHDGYSPEGQFVRKRSKYVSINFMYGY